MDRARGQAGGDKKDNGRQNEDDGDNGKKTKTAMSSTHAQNSDNDLKQQEVNRRRRLIAASNATSGREGARIGLKTHSSSRRLGSFMPPPSSGDASNNQTSSTTISSPNSRSSDRKANDNRRAQLREQKGAHLSVPNLKHLQSLTVEDDRLLVPGQRRNSSFSISSQHSASSAIPDLDDDATACTSTSNPNPPVTSIPRARFGGMASQNYGRFSTRRIMSASGGPKPGDKNAVLQPRRGSFSKEHMSAEMTEIGNTSISNYLSSQQRPSNGMDSSNRTGGSNASSVSARRAMFEATKSAAATSAPKNPPSAPTSSSSSQQEFRRLQAIVNKNQQQAAARSGATSLIKKDGFPAGTAPPAKMPPHHAMGESRRLQQSSSQYTKRAPVAPLINRDGTPCRRHSFKETSPSNSKSIADPDMDSSKLRNAMSSSSYGSVSARRTASSVSPCRSPRVHLSQLESTTTFNSRKAPPSSSLTHENSGTNYAAAPKSHGMDASNDSSRGGSGRRSRARDTVSPPPDLKQLARDETIRLQTLVVRQRQKQQEEQRNSDHDNAARFGGNYNYSSENDENDSNNDENDGGDDQSGGSLFSRPGAFSVQGDSESITRLDRVPAKLFPAGPPPAAGSLAAAAAASVARKRSANQNHPSNSNHPRLSEEHAIAIAQAVLVPDYIDDDDESILGMDDASIRQNNRQRDLLEWTQKELELQEREARLEAREAAVAIREARLAGKAAKLRAWEEELQRQQDRLQEQQPTQLAASAVVGISPDEMNEMSEIPEVPPLRLISSESIVSATSVVAVQKDDDDGDDDDDDDDASITKPPTLKTSNPLAASLTMFQRGGKMKRQQSLKQFLDDNSSKSWRAAGKSLSRLRKGKKSMDNDTSNNTNDTGSVGTGSAGGVEDSDGDSSSASSVATAPGPFIDGAEIKKTAALSAPSTPTSLLGDSLDNGTEHSRADDSGWLPGAAALAKFGLPLMLAARSPRSPVQWAKASRRFPNASVVLLVSTQQMGWERDLKEQALSVVFLVNIQQMGLLIDLRHQGLSVASLDNTPKTGWATDPRDSCLSVVFLIETTRKTGWATDLRGSCLSVVCLVNIQGWRDLCDSHLSAVLSVHTQQAG
jgi:hypothetical protein